MERLQNAFELADNIAEKVGARVAEEAASKPLQHQQPTGTELERIYRPDSGQALMLEKKSKTLVRTNIV